MNIQAYVRAGLLTDEAPGQVDLPRLQKGQAVGLKAVRVPYERFYLGFVYIPSVIVGIVILGIAVFELSTSDFTLILTIGGISLSSTCSEWIVWKLTVAFLLGN